MHSLTHNGNASAKTQCWICRVYGKRAIAVKGLESLVAQLASPIAPGAEKAVRGSFVTVARSADVPANAEQLLGVSSTLDPRSTDCLKSASSNQAFADQ